MSSTTDFTYQNVIWELSITDARDEQMERMNWLVDFKASVGVEMSFYCEEVAVLSLTPSQASVFDTDQGGIVKPAQPGDLPDGA